MIKPHPGFKRVAAISGPFMAAVALLLTIAQRPAAAITLVIDYAYDSSNFFGAGNPSGATAGAQARASLEAVASYYSGILHDTFSSIQTPPDFHSSVSSDVQEYTWSMSFPNPNTGSTVELDDQTIAANEYRIYAGARALGGSTLGIGGPGGYSYAWTNKGIGFSQSENNQLNQINANFTSSVVDRGETTGFASWGGAITFNTASNWSYNHLAAPVAGTNDFLSVAIHELGHALGLGTASEWSALTPGTKFIGSAATSVYGSNPPVNGAKSHWASGTMSTVFGTATPQEASMDPEILVGTRKQFTTLDAAALTDIGWTVVAPPAPNYLAADFNKDTFVDAADLAMWKSAFGVNANGDANNDSRTDGSDFLIWQRQRGMSPPSVVTGTGALAIVPEPHSCVLALCGLAALATQRRRRAARQL